MINPLNCCKKVVGKRRQSVEGQKSHWDFGYSVVDEKTQTEGVVPVAKTTVALDNEIVQSLLQGDLTCLQSVVKDLIEHALESKAEEILQAGRYEWTPDRKGYRNGYRSKWVTTRLGHIPIRVPQMRGGGLDTEELKAPAPVRTGLPSDAA